MRDHDKIRELSKVSNLQGVWLFARDWAVIAAVAGLAMWSQNWLAYLIALPILARQQHALAVLLHEAVHWRLFTNRFFNDLCGQLWGGSPLFFSLPSFRWIHLKHHKDPLAPDDPDLTLTGGYPISPASFKRKLARDLTLRTQHKFIRAFNVGPYPGQLLVWVSYGVAQATLLLAFWYFGSVFDYLWLWIVPQFTLLPVMLRLRGIVEHAGYTRDADQGRNSRTVVAPLGNLLLAPNAVYYHREHHLYPAVPCYNLRKLHRLLREQDGLVPTYFTDYRSVWRQLIQ